MWFIRNKRPQLGIVGGCGCRRNGGAWRRLLDRRGDVVGARCAAESGNHGRDSSACNQRALDARSKENGRGANRKRVAQGERSRGASRLLCGWRNRVEKKQLVVDIRTKVATGLRAIVVGRPTLTESDSKKNFQHQHSTRGEAFLALFPSIEQRTDSAARTSSSVADAV